MEQSLRVRERMAGNQAAGIRPEKRLLLCCARTRLDTTCAERIIRLVEEGLDWSYLLEAAAEHGLMPLLYWHLKEACSEEVPPRSLERLRENFRQNTVHTLYLTAELLKILDLFRADAISAIPYKGPVLAALAYGNLAFREFVDLDIVVRQRDVARAGELLAAQGYRSDFPWTAAPQGAGKIPGQYRFTREADGSAVELHTERTLRYFPIPLDLEELSRGLEPVSLGGREILTFSAEDTLPILSVHGSKHFWDRLSWIADIAELAQPWRGIDWQAATEHARRLGAGRMMDLGLYLASDLLGVALPEEVLRRAREDRAVKSLAAQVRRQLFGESGATPGLAQRFVFRTRMRGNLLDGVRYCFRLAAAPTEDDWGLVRLSGPLSPLYTALRPFRLLRKYGP